ncbi:MAG: T9SS type A sorting domain-containing protein, partial [Bacteroidota bacterium]|nr:T9SS type A sorting domain-containing protein [Bacteroidota bacterium]
GINFRNTETTDNRAYNNIIIDPGAYETIGEDSYIHLATEGITMDKQNNYLGRNVYSVKFDSPANDNYDLQVTSPVINKAKTLSDVDFDIENRPRPISTFSDIGAYECNKAGVEIDELSLSVDKILSYPNPCNESVTFYIRSEKKSIVALTIRNIMGSKLVTKKIMLNIGKNEFTINTKQFSSGIYLYELQFDLGIKSGKIIKR